MITAFAVIGLFALPRFRFSDPPNMGGSETTKTDSRGRISSSSGIQCHSAGIRWILYQMPGVCTSPLGLA
ncbi:hypothetical protein DSO57_1039072 [Entomophthora muscae]|uniref:Uncharacterized protein n=1 Tax=Entomophthora muscae TaxID=34485 RepID=A0ACC2RPE0_9FUNG|nr:hypothetical protein DSO57_1039072 [Entomophthora muscae]